MAIFPKLIMTSRLVGMVLVTLAMSLVGTVSAQHCSTCNQNASAASCDCAEVPIPITPTIDDPTSVTSTPDDSDVAPSPDNLLNMPQDFGNINMNAPSASAGQVAAAFGGGAAAAGIPSMIGDFFGGGGYQYSFLGPDPTTVAVAGGDRQFKFAENNSPFPQNRVFFNYHHFHNAVRDVNGDDQNLNRYTFGLEKTFLDGWASFEVRTPFAGTASSNPTAFSDESPTDTEFGNVALAVKSLLIRGPDYGMSIGLGIILPSGSDFVVSGDVAPNVFRNESVHLQPFFGIYRTHNRSFSQFFLQFDFATNSSEVMAESISDELTTQSLLFLDYAVGHWLIQRPHAKYFRGLAGLVELHYTTTTEDQDYGAFRGRRVFVEDDRRDILNLTGGLFFQIADLTSVKVGAVAPLRTGSDKLFDSEFGLQVVRRY